MNVMVISLRKLIYGFAVLMGLVLAVVLVVWQDPLHVATLFQFDKQSLETTAKAGADPFTSVKPELAMDVKVEKGQVDVTLITNNFTFVPEQKTQSEDTSIENKHGTGHAHLYLNGELLQKIYSPSFSMKNLPIGEHELKVELVYPNHSSYQIQAVKILQIK
ncbi:hypothetical protein [Brevibacillus daliensis]|uniref:hypothetical protein n=1 Tax=Brevibacillus daliensis TaxID=2892995 RepID=UPI001E5F9074|nr:hypothetical protein [Brevibacillus daliensis]